MTDAPARKPMHPVARRLLWLVVAKFALLIALTAGALKYYGFW